jgi:hypothetical protein
MEIRGNLDRGKATVEYPLGDVRWEGIPNAFDSMDGGCPKMIGQATWDAEIWRV